MSHPKERFSIKAKLRSFKYAFSGIFSLLKNEHNAWIHCVATIVAVSGGLWLGLNGMEWLFVVGAILLVFALEMINTAIERVCDAITTEIDPMIKQAKDLAAGAVLVGALFALTVTGVIIYNHRREIF